MIMFLYVRMNGVKDKNCILKYQVPSLYLFTLIQRQEEKHFLTLIVQLFIIYIIIFLLFLT